MELTDETKRKMIASGLFDTAYWECEICPTIYDGNVTEPKDLHGYQICKKCWSRFKMIQVNKQINTILNIAIINARTIIKREQRLKDSM